MTGPTLAEKIDRLIDGLIVGLEDALSCATPTDRAKRLQLENARTATDQAKAAWPQLRGAVEDLENADDGLDDVISELESALWRVQTAGDMVRDNRRPAGSLAAGQ